MGCVTWMIWVRDVLRPWIVSYAKVELAYIRDSKSNNDVVGPQRNVSRAERGVKLKKDTAPEDRNAICVMVEPTASWSDAVPGDWIPHDPVPTVVGKTSIEHFITGDIRIIVLDEVGILGFFCHVRCRRSAVT
jgi:hypothetical protein